MSTKCENLDLRLLTGGIGPVNPSNLKNVSGAPSQSSFLESRLVSAGTARESQNDEGGDGRTTTVAVQLLASGNPPQAGGLNLPSSSSSSSSHPPSPSRSSTHSLKIPTHSSYIPPFLPLYSIHSRNPQRSPPFPVSVCRPLTPPLDTVPRMFQSAFSKTLTRPHNALGPTRTNLQRSRPRPLAAAAQSSRHAAAAR